MSDNVKTAIIAAIVAIVTAAISAFTTISLNKGALDKASTTAKNTQQKTGELLQEVQQTQQKLAAATPNWVRARLEPGWSVHGGKYSDPSYMKDQLGFVHLRGLADGTGGENHPVLILPEGFRPDKQMTSAVLCSGIGPCQIVIGQNGSVWFPQPHSGFVSLDTISFAAAQLPDG